MRTVNRREFMAVFTGDPTATSEFSHVKRNFLDLGQELGILKPRLYSGDASDGPPTTLLLTKQVRRIEMQGAAHWASYRKRASKQHRKYNSSKYKWVSCRCVVDNG